MPSIQNVERRGAVYYWRRTLRFQDGKPLVVRISLRTTDQAVARRMACAMTTKSETLRMTMSQGGGLTIEQKGEMFRKAMASMRDGLDRSHVQFQRTDPDDATFMIEGLVDIYEAMLRDFVVHGIPPHAGTRAHVDERFSDLPEDQREGIMGLFELRPRFREENDEAAVEALNRIGVAQDPDTVAIARKVMLEGKLAAAMEFRRRMRDPMAMWSQVSPIATAAATVSGPAAVEIAEPWASMTPTQAAARFIADSPKITGDAKRKARWTAKTRSQFEASARLLEKSWGAKPLHLLSRDVVVALNVHFSQLPISHHKSPRHDPMTLEEICVEAAGEVKARKRDVATIGLGIGTTNRHFLFLKELATWMARQVPSMPTIDWSDFIYEDDRSARDQRDAYTEEEGKALFQLPIWIGAESPERRLRIGTRVWHDAGYWVPIIAWYTGLRREEICQLTLADVTEHDGIWALAVTDENGGRVKNSVSMRAVPVADELMRLGFIDYVDALHRAGETMLCK